jgi:hypothetical protein
MSTYHSFDTAQSRGSTILDRNTHAFLGNLKFEDDHRVRIRATFSHDSEHLLIDVYSLETLHRARTILQRLPKLNPWQSDFRGTLAFRDRRYDTGVAILYGARIQLRIHFRLLLHAGDQQLEVVK